MCMCVCVYVCEGVWMLLHQLVVCVATTTITSGCSKTTSCKTSTPVGTRPQK